MDGQHGEAASERSENGIDLGIHEAGPGDPGLEVIQPNDLHTTSKGVQSVLDTADERLQVLPPENFFIGVPRVAKDGLDRWGRR